MNRTALTFILILVLCIPAVTGGEGPRITINASRQNVSYGDTLVFSGASNGFTMYFFMTGPNLDPAGVMTFNTTKSARSKGHVTAIPRDGTWHWGWKTGNVKGPLLNGNYTIYACIGPFDTEQLASCERCNCVNMNVTLTGSPASRVTGAVPTAPEALATNATPPVSPVSPAPANGSTATTPSLPAPSSGLLAGIAATVAGLLAIRRDN